MLTLDPYLKELPEGKEIRAALPQAIEAVRKAPSGEAMGERNVTKTLTEALRRRATVSSAPKQPPLAAPGRLAVGARVVLSGLNTRPQLNGAKGEVPSPPCHPPMPSQAIRCQDRTA